MTIEELLQSLDMNLNKELKSLKEDFQILNQDYKSLDENYQSLKQEYADNEKKLKELRVLLGIEQSNQK